MEVQYIKPNRLVEKIEKCYCPNKNLKSFLDILIKIKDENLGELATFNCKNVNEIIIYHKENFDINMIIMLYENGDIEYTSVIGNDYFLNDQTPEQKMKPVLEKFLEGNYVFQNLYHFEKLVESKLSIGDKIIKSKAMSFVNQIKQKLFPNDFILKKEIGLRFY